MKLTNEDILSVLYTAKSRLLADKTLHDYICGMCFYIRASIYSILNISILYSEIKNIIPEFIPETFGLNAEYNSFWWDIEDINSRINAFNKLIEIYENKLKIL